MNIFKLLLIAFSSKDCHCWDSRPVYLCGRMWRWGTSMGPLVIRISVPPSPPDNKIATKSTLSAKILVREEDLQNMFWFFGLGILAISARCVVMLY